MNELTRFPKEVRERAIRMVFEHTEEHNSQWATIQSIAGKIGMSPETLRKWVRQAERDEGLKPEIQRVHRGSFGGVYGARKVWLQLGREGIAVARCTVERLMRDLGLKGVRRGAFKVTTISDSIALRPAVLVERNFQAGRPNQLWVADITYVATWNGLIFVTFVTDAFSRRIVGWRVSSSLRSDLALDALEMALWARGKHSDGLVHHSDRGSQYLSIRYTERLAEDGGGAEGGSIFDADYPHKWVNIACRLTRSAPSPPGG